MDMDMWTYRESMPATTDTLTRFAVEATDGSIGHVDAASDEMGAGFIVVDTGPWIFGRKVVIPAGAISRVDLDKELVMLDLTKQQIKDSPDFDPDIGWDDSEYRGRLGEYYEPFFRPIRTGGARGETKA
jgi:hypothetical protein